MTSLSKKKCNCCYADSQKSSALIFKEGVGTQKRKKPLFDFYCFQCDFPILFGSYFQSFPATTLMFLYAKPLFSVWTCSFRRILAGKALVSKCLSDYCHFYINAIEKRYICVHKIEIKGFTQTVMIEKRIFNTNYYLA